MKTITLTIAALALLSIGASASQRGHDLRDTEYWTTDGVSRNTGDPAVSSTASAALAVDKGISKGTNFERTTELSIENLQGRH